MVINNPVTQSVLNELNIIQYLDCTENKKINNVNKFFDTIKILRCANSGISDISKLVNLEEFRGSSEISYYFDNNFNTI